MDFKRTMNMFGLKLKKAGPTIAVTAGMVGVVGATVKACVDTPKAIEKIEYHKDNLEKIQHYADEVKDGNIDDPEYDPEKDCKNDLFIEKVHMVRDCVKVYLPTIAIESLSLFLIAKGFKTMKVRAAGLSAALTATNVAYNAIETKFREQVGDDKADAFELGGHIEKEKEKIEGEDGKTKTVTKNQLVIDIPSEVDDDIKMYAEGASPYSMLWGPRSDVWDDVDLYRQNYIVQCVTTLNNQLRDKGVIFLNDVATMFGLKKRQAWQFVGWKWTGPDDDYKIDLKPITVKTRNQETGEIDELVVLTPNVDGVVLDQLL